jgi:hypothetical protein
MQIGGEYVYVCDVSMSMSMYNFYRRPVVLRSHLLSGHVVACTAECMPCLFSYSAELEIQSQG